MNHPNPEEWVPYLYRETTPQTRRQLQEHLRECAACRRQVAGWRQSLRRLDAWEMPHPPRRAETVPFGVRWALAAAVVVLLVGAGTALGRWLIPIPNGAALRAAIEPEIRQQLRQEIAQQLRDELARSAATTLALADQRSQALLADYARNSERQRTEDRRTVAAALDTLAARHLADWAALKNDVDTLAVNADAGLRQTEQQLVQLADYTQPAPPVAPVTRGHD